MAEPCSQARPQSRALKTEPTQLPRAPRRAANLLFQLAPARAAARCAGLESRGDARLQPDGARTASRPLARCRSSSPPRAPRAPAPRPLPLFRRRERAARLARPPARGGAARRAAPGRRLALEQRRRQRRAGGCPAGSRVAARAPRTSSPRPAARRTASCRRAAARRARAGPSVACRPAAANRGRPRTCRRRRRGRPGPCRRPLVFCGHCAHFCCKCSLLWSERAVLSRACRKRLCCTPIA